MKANDGQANLILLDSAPQPEWNFAALMEAETGEKWNIWHIDSHFSDSAWKKKAKFFLFPLKVLRHRKEFGTILSYQQFYGLFFAFYSAIFHLKKHSHLIVTTFIYRPKQGWKGKLYAWFMRKAVNSPALDKIVCFSSSEPAYYQSIFGTDKFTYVPLDKITIAIEEAASAVSLFLVRKDSDSSSKKRSKNFVKAVWFRRGI